MHYSTGEGERSLRLSLREEHGEAAIAGVHKERKTYISLTPPSRWKYCMHVAT
ncbi:hypothetical protein TPADAL_0226a [Treponema pallidum subsp. pallidum DAL-1]|uniref:Uncharacterized protein n=2 Tax=Treponema pallidum TaxID=160 RepID=A0AAU8RLF5_TREPL|nr:hypothetical protein TPESAMD_0226a [Treponema pallidum subsp. pertenue str. SamoaD]AEZ58418.1 hypothetical protein TPECDC2_0226a [Treponema pallidum subsp. pertenue str. CDC2]AEZ59486.1 hypothetical protein TPEGAU_0226a [Treponema pallidum subsp. pertenue str. Gauthier]AEZ60550.1 hypothetical protein TPADAL_0226a [Treponema pallidum subsp. pallidum DAL-1]AGK83874.1 hypothetical protein TPFB_0226a [Treponema pallidum str. Fribourg-Blanc]AJB40249.1 hypothetical protein TENDBA_0226a [Treponema